MSIVSYLIGGTIGRNARLWSRVFMFTMANLLSHIKWTISSVMQGFQSKLSKKRDARFTMLESQMIMKTKLENILLMVHP